MAKFLAISVYLLTLLLPINTQAQSAAAKFAGMWSDPPDTPEGLFCFFSCSDYALEVLGRLLDDPANDDRPYGALTAEANRMARQKILVPKMTAAALRTFPLDPAADPGFLRCEPWGFARQIFGPHQNEISINNDHIEMHYGEWDAHRIIYMDGRSVPPNIQSSLLGFSTGHFEGATLVVNTTHVNAGILSRMDHSDQLSAEERYSISNDGQIMTLDVTFTDPWALTEPLTLKKIWSWSPDEEIYPYVDCEIPTDFIESQGEKI
ncbi:MAG: hypothetical protein IIC59_08540 [Proteobacteria bacterium]|nr:hypothetical protein [Pseudomonadota bacterium]MCH8175215.1 hypothetical protein [Pseudomonadota bacterium]